MRMLHVTLLFLTFVRSTEAASRCESVMRGAGLKVNQFVACSASVVFNYGSEARHKEVNNVKRYEPAFVKSGFSK